MNEREKKKEKEKKEEKEKEEKEKEDKMEKAVLKVLLQVHRPLNAFPSTGLGNNITPIKGELGKNTTPTGRGP